MPHKDCVDEIGTTTKVNEWANSKLSFASGLVSSPHNEYCRVENVLLSKSFSLHKFIFGSFSVSGLIRYFICCVSIRNNNLVFKIRTIMGSMNLLD